MKAKARQWDDDPIIQEAMRRRAIRNGILRTAIIWTPPFVLFMGLFLYFLVDRLTGGDSATWFLLVVMAVFALLFGLQAIHAMLDLRGEPRRYTGDVTRRWSRTDSFISRSHYVRIDRQILRGDPYILDGIKEGDRVSAEYYPRTGVLIALERVVPSEPAGSATSDAEPSARQEGA